MRLKMLFAALAAITSVSLAACSNSDDSADLPSNVNKADVTFAQQMIPHHEQATEMASLAASRSTDPAVLDLASRIEAAQGPEIKTMTGWLKEWGVEQDAGESGGMAGMDHGSTDDDAGSSMAGMMSDEDMAALESSSGTEFDSSFLTMMIKHHEGAIVMAKAEQADGKNPDAVTLAKKMKQDQTAEIAEMKTLLKG